MPETHVAECVRGKDGWKVIGYCVFKGQLRTLGCDVVQPLPEPQSLSSWRKARQKLGLCYVSGFIETLLSPGSWYQYVFLGDTEHQISKVHAALTLNPTETCGLYIPGYWLNDLDGKSYRLLKSHIVDTA